MAIRTTAAGIEVGLPHQMCLDKHVPDFLDCLLCWFRRNMGDPKYGGAMYWRLHRLDLSHNDLSDDSIARVVAALRHGDVRVQRLLLSGNRMQCRGVEALTQYIWGCSEAVVELDLADNDIAIAVGADGDDAISALLRCLYNHPSYPRRVAPQELILPTDCGRAGRGTPDHEPLMLRIAGNRVADPEGLLRIMRAKGSADKVRVRSDSQTYSPEGEEFLSVFLPDFARQRCQQQQQQQQTQVASIKPALVNTLVSASFVVEQDIEPGHRLENDRCTEESADVAAEAFNCKTAAQRRSSKQPRQQSCCCTSSSSSSDDKANVKWLKPQLDEIEEEELEHDLSIHLQSLGICNDASTQVKLVEFTVKLLTSGKDPGVLKSELTTFLGAADARLLTDWIVLRVQSLRR